MKPSRKKEFEFKSKFEKVVSDFLGIGGEYEVDTIPFIQPEAKRKYKPDFRIAENIYIECKGIFSVEDRKKMLWVKEQHPDKTFYLLFYNAHQRLRKGSKTTYAQWAEDNGFEWADWFKSGRKVPDEWLNNNNKKD